MAIPHIIPDTITRLSLKSTNKKSPFLKSLHHFSLDTGKTRQKRSERRANILLLSKLMISEIELETLAWGQFFKNHKGERDIYTRGIDYLVKKTGLPERAINRSLADMERCGYIQVTRRQAKTKDNNITRIISLRRFTKKFFYELGFKKNTIENAIDWKRKKNDKKFGNLMPSVVCKNTFKKFKDIMSHHATQATKKINKLPTLKPVQQRKPADTKQLLAKAAAIAERLGTSPLEELRKLTT